MNKIKHKKTLIVAVMTVAELVRFFVFDGGLFSLIVGPIILTALLTILELHFSNEAEKNNE